MRTAYRCGWLELMALCGTLAVASSVRAEDLLTVRFREPNRVESLERIAGALCGEILDIGTPDIVTRGYEQWYGHGWQLRYRPSSGFVSWRDQYFLDLSGNVEKVDTEVAGKVALEFLQYSGVVALDASDEVYVLSVTKGVRHSFDLRSGTTTDRVEHLKVVFGRRIAGIDVVGASPAVVYVGAGYQIVGVEVLWREVAGMDYLDVASDKVLEGSYNEAVVRAEADSGLGFEGDVGLPPRIVFVNYSWSHRQMASIPYEERWAVFSGVVHEKSERLVWSLLATGFDRSVETAAVERVTTSGRGWGEEAVPVLSGCGPDCL